MYQDTRCFFPKPKGCEDSLEDTEAVPVDTLAMDSILQLKVPPEITPSALMQDKFIRQPSSENICQEIHLTPDSGDEGKGKLRPKYLFLES